MRLLVQLVNVANQIIGIRPAVAVPPVAVVVHTPDLAVQAKGAARGNPDISTVLDAVSEQAHAVGARVAAHAVVEEAKVEAVLEGAVLNELLAGYLVVVVYEAVCEAQVQFRVRVLGGGAQEDDVAEALGLTVHTLDAVVVVCCSVGGEGVRGVVGEGWVERDDVLSDKRQAEVDLVRDVCHDGQHELLQTCARIRAL